MKKKAIFLLLFVLAFSCFASANLPTSIPEIPKPALRAQESGEEKQTFTFEGINYEVLSESELTCITQPMSEFYSGNNASGDVVIPEKVVNDGKEYTVVAIGLGSFYFNQSIKSVTLPSSITAIGTQAFALCFSLKNINIPEGVTMIGDFAFGNTGLESVTLPAGITNIGKNPFYGCAQLSEIILDENPYYEFANPIFSAKDSAGTPSRVISCLCSSRGEITLPNTVEVIDDYAFNSCYYLTSVSFPEGLTSIGEYAFSYCYGITSYEFPESVTSLGVFAFNDNSALTSISFPSAITAIPNGICMGCTKLSSVKLPNTVTEIGDEAFRNCNSLSEIDLPSSLTAIGYMAFSKCAISEFSIPESVNSLGDYALSGCQYLTSCELPSTITSIPKGFFNSCLALETFTIPEQITFIGDAAFSSCIELQSIHIPVGVTELGNASFSNCPKLESIELPDGLTVIGDRAFSYCIELKDIRMGDKLRSIGNEAFIDCAFTKMVLPSTLETIGDYAFTSCKQLTDIDLGQSIVSIGAYAFYRCIGIESIVIPASVTTIGNNAFFHCPDLTKVYCLNTVPLEIQDNVFECDSYTVASDHVYKHATLYVPSGSVDAYKAAAGWSEFSAIQSIPSITLANLPVVEYGADAIDLSAYADGNSNLVYLSTNPEVAEVDGNNLRIRGAGEVMITAQTGNASFTLIENANRLFVVGKADLNVTAKSYTVTEGDPMPEFEVEFSGFVYDDTVADIEEVPTVSCTADNTDTPGLYTLTPIGGYAQNYNLICHNGTLVVEEDMSGIESVAETTMQVHSDGSRIIIEGVAQGGLIEIYSASGNMLAKINSTGYPQQYIPESQGVYIIRSGKFIRKIAF